MNQETIKTELQGLTDGELDAVRSILEFNLRGILVGDRDETISKLRLVFGGSKEKAKITLKVFGN
jgi:hypothetical protein